MIIILPLLLGCQIEPPLSRQPVRSISKADLSEFERYANQRQDAQVDSRLSKLSDEIEHLHEHSEAVLTAVAKLTEALPTQQKPPESPAVTQPISQPGKFPPDAPPAEDESTPKTKSDNRRFTGIIMETRDPAVDDCVPCRWANWAFDNDLARFGWTKGQGPEFDVWVKYVDGETPIFRIIQDGKQKRTIVGFSAHDEESAIREMRRIMRLHPRATFSSKSDLSSSADPDGPSDSPDCAGSARKLLADASCSAPNFGLSTPSCSTPLSAAPDCAGVALAAPLLAPSNCGGLVEVQSPGEWAPRYFDASSMPVRSIHGSGRLSASSRAGVQPSALVAHGPAWGWPGNTIGSLKRHLMSAPHNYSRSQLAGLTASQLMSLHSNEHEKHARVTGSRIPYLPGFSGPFYGSLKTYGGVDYARAPKDTASARRRTSGASGLSLFGLPIAGLNERSAGDVQTSSMVTSYGFSSASTGRRGVSRGLSLFGLPIVGSYLSGSQYAGP